MKRLVCLACICLVMMGVGACDIFPTSRAINDLTLAHMLVLDLEDDGTLVLGTLIDDMGTSVQPAEDSPSGGSSDQQRVLTARGSTLTEASEQLQRQSPHIVFWGHIDMILLGDKLLKSGLWRFADYLIRNQNLPMSANLYAVASADLGALCDSPEQCASLYQLLRKYALPSTNRTKTTQLSLLDFAREYSVEMGSFVLPMVTKIDTKDTKTPAEVAGGAIVRQKQMVGTLSDSQMRGYNALRNALCNDVFAVEIDQDLSVAVKSLRAWCSIVPQLSAGRLVGYQIAVNAECGINELISSDGLDAEDIYDQTCRGVEQGLVRDIDSCIAQMGKLRADFVGLHRAYRIHHRTAADRARDGWEDGLGSLHFAVSANVKIEREYQARVAPRWEPLALGGEK